MKTDDERRQFERAFPRRTTARVEINGLLHDFQILDESDGGIGLYSGMGEQFLQDSVVLVTVATDEARQAIVRYISHHPNGGYQVGLQWV
jgi:hypothetical protein